MPRYKMVVLTKPHEGRDDEFNDWYQNLHLEQVTAIPGIKSAQRFRLADSVGTREALPYLAIYEIETDDIKTIMDEFLRRSGTDSLVISDAMDMDNMAAFYEEIGPEVKG